MVANGSFLLNAMLVNHEHRKLAGKLIDCLGAAKQRVVFLESGPGGPPLYDQEPAGESTGVEIFHAWPTNWILLHLAAAGIVFCFARWPVFGRPREPEREAVADFGKHIDALAELLARSRDRTYAMARLLHYQQATRSDSRRETPALDLLCAAAAGRVRRAGVGAAQDCRTGSFRSPGRWPSTATIIFTSST